MTQQEIKFLEKFTSIINSCTEYDHLSYMINYITYISDNEFYSFDYKFKLGRILRNKAWEFRQKDLEIHNAEMDKLIKKRIELLT